MLTLQSYFCHADEFSRIKVQLALQVDCPLRQREHNYVAMKVRYDGDTHVWRDKTGIVAVFASDT